jgi:hypothetical protein
MPWKFARLAFALPAIVFAVRDGLFGAVLISASGWWQVSGSFVVVPCTDALVFGQKLHRPDAQVGAVYRAINGIISCDFSGRLAFALTVRIRSGLRMETIVWLVLVVLLVVVVVHAATWWWRRDSRGARGPMRKNHRRGSR